MLFLVCEISCLSQAGLEMIAGTSRTLTSEYAAEPWYLSGRINHTNMSWNIFRITNGVYERKADGCLLVQIWLQWSMPNLIAVIHAISAPLPNYIRYTYIQVHTSLNLCQFIRSNSAFSLDSQAKSDYAEFKQVCASICNCVTVLVKNSNMRRS